MLVVLTTTGARPEAFDICQNLMRRQTYAGEVTWIIVDDGPDPQPRSKMPRNWRTVLVRPKPLWAPGENTQGRNLIVGIRQAIEIAGNALELVIVEDDDWYHPDWINFIADFLSKAELVGEGDARYYDVRRRRWKQHGNFEHASLRCSAMRGSAIQTFLEILKTPYKYYDLKLWAAHRNKLVSNTRLTVGMKSLPGRSGIGVGHDGSSGRFDHDGAVLRSWIGADAALYEGFYERHTVMKDAVFVLKAHKYGTRMMQAGETYVPENPRHRKLLIAARRVRALTQDEMQPKASTSRGSEPDRQIDRKPAAAPMVKAAVIQKEPERPEVLDSEPESADQVEPPTEAAKAKNLKRDR